jgi:serine protease Do
MSERVASDRSIGLKMLAVVGLISLVLGIGVSQSFDLFRVSNASYGAGATPQGFSDFVTLAKKLGPVVVNVSSTRVRERGQGLLRPFGEEDPDDELFGVPNPRGRFGERNLGSGFIIHSDGAILTNHHVVEGAQKIIVKLPGGREFEAKVVGQDSRTDIAIIRIDAKESLPTAILGNSDKIEVGEWVMAVGNPFGLDNSVTSGIVSAKGRHIGAGPYDDFIQTDASVNPGSSGGPLVNLRGEVVGINAAIVSQTGANIGIGFAIPINLVKEILPQLKEKGKVTRGFLGVSVQNITPMIAESLGLDKARGALVANVERDGPADRAGVKVRDIIMEFDGKEIRDATDLPILVARSPVNKLVRIKVLREKQKLILNTKIAELKESRQPQGREKLG